MTAPLELSLDSMRLFFLEKGGKVTNHDLVNNFKSFLTNPQTRDQSRAKFKEYVNSIAMVKHENNVKYLVLKKENANSSNKNNTISKSHTNTKTPSSKPSKSVSDNVLHSSIASTSNEHLRVPESNTVCVEAEINPDHKDVQENQNPGNFDNEVILRKSENNDFPAKVENADRRAFHFNVNDLSPQKSPSEVIEEDSVLFHSVREKMQKFNKMVESSDKLALKEHTPNKMKLKSEESCGAVGGTKRVDQDDDDKSSITLDVSKRDIWLVKAAQGDFQELCKLANENHYLPKVKDPATSYTALHWAAKMGNENIAKLLAGTYRVNVNARTNGGYTPLHIAAQFKKIAFFDFLIQVYGADQNIRDYSGKKPHQYLQHSDPHSFYQDTPQKLKTRKKQLDRDGFLRIGSLNVRVRRTTEAVVTHFLGPSTSKLQPYQYDSNEVYYDKQSKENVQVKQMDIVQDVDAITIMPEKCDEALTE